MSYKRGVEYFLLYLCNENKTPSIAPFHHHHKQNSRDTYLGGNVNIMNYK